jgi:immune inhibitor A
MSMSSAMKRQRRLLALAPVVALATAGIATGTSAAATTAAPAVSGPDGAGGDYYINYVEPAVQKAVVPDVQVTKGENAKQVPKDAVERGEALDRKYSQGNPVAARGLAELEAEAIRTGQSPKSLKNRYKGSRSTQEAKLLTILVEFDDEAQDDFTDSWVPTSWGATDCKKGEVVSGPLHNNIPDPADYDHLDNNSMWVPDFSPQHYDTMLYTKAGITDRVRTDLTGPDGEKGFDISGYTMKNMYEEMSHGAYTVDGEATPWVKVDHSEGWYGATRCSQNDKGEWVAGAYQGMQGHPDNPLGPGQLPIDAVNKLAEMDPDFPWADYDLEDQGDVDGDKNFNEPDGVIDHVVLVHAGEDKSGGGGAEGTYAIWAHSSAVAGGAAIPGTDLKLRNYIVQPEDSGVGVFAHEYGHDLGLPDLYDTSGNGDSDVDFWDLMSSGSHAGPIFQSMPTHMGLWDKYVLGWADPVQINPGDDPRSVKVGQNSRPLKGTADGIKVNLPRKDIVLATPHSGSDMWYTGADQDWADIRLTRSVDVPADAKFWMWNNYVIEEDWDYGFVEVSTDGGSTWAEQKVYDESGALVSTGDGYGDPNHRMADFGGKRYGLTGDTHGWRHDFVDLSGFAGQTVQVRLRQATDAGYLDRGWFADDFAVTSGADAVWTDDVESGANGWTAEAKSFVDTSGPGWRIDSGSTSNAQYYLVEWRNFDGFDEGLKYAYDTVYSDGAWKVDKIRYNAPGALVWYRDTSLGNANHVVNNATALPSGGAKGGLLIVDSHYQPLRRTGAAADFDPSSLDNMPSRPQSSNAAFGLQKTYPFTECMADVEKDYEEYCTDIPALPAVSTFTDAKSWVPGLEYRPDLDPKRPYFWRDIDASAVVPSAGFQPYTTPIVDKDGNLLPGMFGLNFGFTVTGTGNPADAGVAFGTEIEVAKAFPGNTAGLIKVTPPAAE